MEGNLKGKHGGDGATRELKKGSLVTVRGLGGQDSAQGKGNNLMDPCLCSIPERGVGGKVEIRKKERVRKKTRLSIVLREIG